MKVTPDMTIGELIRLDENIVPILGSLTVEY